MRLAWLGLLAPLLLACPGDAAPVDRFGADCSMGESCDTYSCVEGVCASPCASGADCRAGSECRASGGSGFCLARRWAAEPGEFGTSCAIGGAADCATDFVCASLRADDPEAYCTSSCKADLECPPGLRCQDYGDGTLKCVRREFCSPCDLDSDCKTSVLPDGACSADSGGGKFCSKACDPAGETCPAGFLCDGTTRTCVHHTGSCVGDGTNCAPCTTDGDCSTTGGDCLRFYFSGETFCSETCGSCDSPYQCNMGNCVPPESWRGTCTGG